MVKIKKEAVVTETTAQEVLTSFGTTQEVAVPATEVQEVATEEVVLEVPATEETASTEAQETATEETPAAPAVPVKPAVPAKPAVPFTIHPANNAISFKTLLQDGVHKKVSKKKDKKAQAIMMQSSLSSMQAYYVSGKHQKLVKLNIMSIMDPDAFKLQQAPAALGADASRFKGIKKKEVTLENGSKKVVQEIYYKDVIFVASESTEIEKFKTEAESSAFVTASESGQTRVASRGVHVNITAESSKGNMSVLLQDATSLAVIDTKRIEENKEVILNTLFENGFFFRTRESNGEELTSLSQLVRYSVTNDTPSQKRAGKITMLAETNSFNKYDFMKELGNDMKAFMKEKNINGVPYYYMDLFKNQSRLALLGSASMKMHEFNNYFGLFALEEVKENGDVVITTTTGLKVLFTDDVYGKAAAAAQIFNPGAAKNKPGEGDVTVTTSEEFNHLVNVTDGSIITDAEQFCPMLKKMGAGGKKGGKIRGYFSQFRTNVQGKGANLLSLNLKKETGYDMILFGGAMKTNFIEMLKDGFQMEYHVMLISSAFKEDAFGRISAQSMNNLNMDAEYVSNKAKETFAKARKAIEEETVEEAFNVMHGDKEVADIKNSDIKFGMEKFLGLAPELSGDFMIKKESYNSLKDLMRNHATGGLHVNSKNSYMYTDAYAILKSIKKDIRDEKGRRFVDPSDMAAKKGEVILPMIGKDGKRFFFTGNVATIRSPHNSNKETQFAKAIDPVAYAKQNGLDEMAAYWEESLEKGLLDGVVFFSAEDIMVPASSGADFDGDTCLVIIDQEFIAKMKQEPQYINNFLREDVEYQYNEKGHLIGGVVNGTFIDNSDCLGSGCPWSGQPNTPSINLIDGMYQDDKFGLYMPKEFVDNNYEEAYRVWVDSMIETLKVSISASDMGRMSNILMSITNGRNHIKQAMKNNIAKKEADPRKAKAVDAANRNLKEELSYYNQMHDMFTAVVWYEVDAAKHGGAYREMLENWMQWALSRKGMKKELSIETTNMKRIIGYKPSSVDFNGNVIKSKLAVLLPSALYTAKNVFAASTTMNTSIEAYAANMRKEIGELNKEIETITISGNNILSKVYGILAESTVNTQEAREIYRRFVELLEKKDKKLAAKALELELKANEANKAAGYDFENMTAGKKRDAIIKLFPDYKKVTKARNTLLIAVRGLLRKTLIEKSIDVVGFAAAVYAEAYEKALSAEKKNNKKKAYHVHTAWRLIENELILLFSEIGGKNVKGLTSQVFDLKDLYITLNEGTEKKMSRVGDKKYDIALESVVENGVNRFNVYLLKQGDDATASDLIATCEGSAASLLVKGAFYRLQGVTFGPINSKGKVSIQIEKTHLLVNKLEALQPKAAKEFYDELLLDAEEVAIAFYKKATAADMGDGDMINLIGKVIKGKTVFGSLVDGKLNVLAITLEDVGYEEGKDYLVALRIHNKKAYVYESAVIE